MTDDERNYPAGMHYYYYCIWNSLSSQNNISQKHHRKQEACLSCASILKRRAYIPTSRETELKSIPRASSKANNQDRSITSVSLFVIVHSSSLLLLLIDSILPHHKICHCISTIYLHSLFSAIFNHDARGIPRDSRLPY